jgi:pyrroloquinoline-quinone synthase
MNKIEQLVIYEDVEQQMELVVNQLFHQGDFFQQLLGGNYSIEQIRYFAIQYSYYSRHFPRVLGAAISAMSPIDSWWVPLADNLWDEAGRGMPGKSHQRLYEGFLKTVDPHIILDQHGFPEEPISPAVEKAVETFITFFRGCSPLEAMSAVGLGSEFFAGQVMGMIGKGLKHPNYNKDRAINVLFWDIHADEHEPHHYQLCKNILCQFTSEQELHTMFKVGKMIAASEATMYKELHMEMLKR